MNTITSIRRAASTLKVAIDCRLMYYRKAGVSYYARRLVQALDKESAANSSGPPVTLSVILDRRDTDTDWVPSSVCVIRAITPAHHRYERLTLPLELAAIANRQFPRSRFRFAERQSGSGTPIDILHSPDFITCRGRFKKVITIHDLYFVQHPEVMNADGARYYNQVRWSAQTADRIIAVSRFTRNDILRLIPEVDPHKIAVVHEAADEAKIENAELRIQNSLLSILHSQFILFVGTLEPRKNLSTLLRALAQLPGHVRLVVVGAVGWRDAEPGHIARELGVSERVTFAGRVSDEELDALYRGARLLAMPSLSEGFGLPVIEAMSRGLPVVCSNTGSLPEIAKDAALLHAPMDATELARHIQALWTDDALRAEYGRRALARAKKFSWERAARETLDVYKMAIDD